MSKLMAQLQCDRQTSCKTLMTILQLLFAVTIFNIKCTTVCATMPPEMIVNSDDATSDANAASYASEKRSSWQSLQGPWGKRTIAGAAAVGGSGGGGGGVGGVGDEATAGDTEDDVFLAERWAPMLMNNGERTDPIVKYTMIYLTNTANMDRLSQQKQADEAAAASAAGSGRMMNEALLASIDDAVDGNADGLFMNEKRTWKNMNAAWGKRRNAPTWNKFGGAWGKREPGWNNLKGMWGKRASKDWQKLNGGWGKRADII